MISTKRQNLPSGLWVVATPIGNLADLSPRAAQALEQADCILCEDTRRTAALLSGIGMPLGALRDTKEKKFHLERFDAHVEKQAIPKWIQFLQSGHSLALVTDAGTPGVSDPGVALVAAAHEAGISVTPIPGPSAVMALISVSGLSGNAFTFRGFFPRKLGDQKKELEKLLASQAVWMWFESPHRIEKSIHVIAEWAEKFPKQGHDVKIIAAKEMTKVHEKFFRGNVQEVYQEICEEIRKEGEVGEWCFAIEGQESSQDKGQDRGEWVRAVRCALALGASVTDIALQISQEFGIPKREVYQKTLEMQADKEGR